MTRRIPRGLLLLASGVACARPEAPPGGPEDLLPPIVVETVPDTFAAVEAGVREIHFRFSERISERPANGVMNDAIVVSPSTGNVIVKHRRDGISVEMQEGLAAGRVYRVTVLPVINDMFGNRLRDPFDLVLSTGDEMVPNVVAGMVEDRVTGQGVPGVRVEARFPRDGDTVTHWNFTGDDGVFSLRYVPDGPFEVRAWHDRNRDRELGETEPRTDFLPGLLPEAPDTSFTVLSLIEPDTTPARLASVTAEDSVTLRFEFDDYLEPDLPGLVIGAMLVVATPEETVEAAVAGDSVEVAAGDSVDVVVVDSAEVVVDSVEVAVEDSVEVAAGDSAEVAVGDSVEVAAGDSAVAVVAVEDSAAAEPAVDARPPPLPGDTIPIRVFQELEYERWQAERADSLASAAADSLGPVDPVEVGEAADSAEVPAGNVGLSGLQLPVQTLIGVLDEPLYPGTPYEATLSGVVSIAGTPNGGGTAVVVWEPPQPDSAMEEDATLEPGGVPVVDTTLVLDSTLVVDTTMVVPDIVQVPDSVQAADTVPVPDTVQVPDTSRVIPDTTEVPDTSRPVPDTTQVRDAGRVVGRRAGGFDAPAAETAARPRSRPRLRRRPVPPRR